MEKHSAATFLDRKCALFFFSQKYYPSQFRILIQNKPFIILFRPIYYKIIYFNHLQT